MNMFADLHMHSTYSDGRNTPSELCMLAEEHNVKVISITDHDTIDAHKWLEKNPQNANVKVIPGVEITLLANHKMLHILGYDIDIHSKDLECMMQSMSAEITKSTRLNFEKAYRNSIISYSWERVVELNPDESRLGGSRVIKAMSMDGYKLPGMELAELYQKYFLCTNPSYIWHTTHTAYDVINTIKAAGGIPVIAHPKSVGGDSTVLDLIRYGVQGLEVYHPSHSYLETAKYLQMATENKLYVTGGSDWHGVSDNNPSHMGRPFAGTGLEHGDYGILKVK